jgi:hypothetical protein
MLSGQLGREHVAKQHAYSGVAGKSMPPNARGAQLNVGGEPVSGPVRLLPDLSPRIFVY